MAIASRAAAEEAPTRRIFFIAGAGARSGPNIAIFEDERAGWAISTAATSRSTISCAPSN
jgi:hypothetical protein